MPDAEGQAAQPLSELDVELAPIDERLEVHRRREGERSSRPSPISTPRSRRRPQNEMVLGGLERELANLQAQYDAAVASLGQAQVGERIEVLSKGERFSLIEHADDAGRAGAARPRLLIAAAGVVGGVGAGLGFIVLMEMLNRSIRRPVELASGLGIQPFATIPYIRTRREPRRKRTRSLAVLALIAVVIPAALFAIHTYYMPLDQLLAASWLARASPPRTRPAGFEYTCPARRRQRKRRRMERIQAAIQKAKEQRGDVARAAPGGRRRSAAARPAARRGRRRRPGLGRARGLRARAAADARGTASSPSRDVDPAHSHLRHAAHQVLRTMRQNGWTSLGITSPTAGCGKTTLGAQPRLQPRPPAGRAHGARGPRPAPAGGGQAARAQGAAVDGERAAGHPRRRRELRALRRQPRHRHQRQRVRDSAELLHERRTAEGVAALKAPSSPTSSSTTCRRCWMSDDVMAFLPHARLRAPGGRRRESRLDEVDKCEQDLAEQTNVLGVVLNKCRYMGEDYGYYEPPAARQTLGYRLSTGPVRARDSLMPVACGPAGRAEKARNTCVMASSH